MTLSPKLQPPHPAEPDSPPDAPAPAGGFPTADVGGIPVAVTTLPAAVEWLQQWSERRLGGIGVRLVNAYTIVSAHADERYLRLVRSSGVSLPDGTPVMLALRSVAGQRDAGRVRGPSFFVRALERAAGTGVREYFLGTTDETLQELEAAVRRSWPEAEIAGRWAPPFTEAVDDDFIRLCREQIAAADPDRVWVALGTPKQDYLADRLGEALGVPCIAVGAAFDFLAGTKREAPRLFQRLGIEWVFRFASEPRRLWRRYVFGNAAFVRIVLRERG